MQAKCYESSKVGRYRFKKNNNCKKLSALGDIKAKGVGFEQLVMEEDR